MKPRRKFQPSGTWALEDRIALSHAGGAVAEVAAVATTSHHLTGTFGGALTTTLPKGVGGGDQAVLASTTVLPTIGLVKLNGNLSANGSLPPQFSGTHGTITLTGAVKRHPGTLTLAVSGPFANLAPTKLTTTHLTFTVQSATGPFASSVGSHGTADLTLVAKLPKPRRGQPKGGVAHGQFKLVLTET